MMDEVCKLASRDERFNSRTVCAHVWTDNAEGLWWYQSRGFSKVEPVIEGYYRRLNPSDAWIVRRDITMGPTQKSNGGVLDAVKANGIGGPQERAQIPNDRVSTPAVAGFTNTAPPPSTLGPIPTRPGPPLSGTSYQKKGPEHEWNDLPVEMVAVSRQNSSNLSVPGSGANSGASSRSNSTLGRKKRDRSYPAAAFGN